MAFGMYGTYVPIFIVFIAGMVFVSHHPTDLSFKTPRRCTCLTIFIQSGIQAYYGGQAMTLMLRAIFPTFNYMKNTLPLSAAITTQDLIGFLIYCAVYTPILWVIKPYQLRLGLYPTFVATIASFTGILIWALVSNGGAGDLLTSATQLTTSQKAFRFIQCVSGISGTWGGAADRYSDWSRFERKRGTSIPGLFALPVVVTISALFGVLTTTATSKMYGFVQWNPILLLQYTQSVSYTPACRAGTFFVGFSIFWAQVFLNMSQNSIPYGMDVSGAFPRYFTTKRAAFMLLLITVIIQPWRFLSQASIFLTILSSVSSMSTFPTFAFINLSDISYFSLLRCSNSHRSW
jgi:NCS1 family nucleobase:cation symporter-1